MSTTKVQSVSVKNGISLESLDTNHSENFLGNYINSQIALDLQTKEAEAWLAFGNDLQI